MIDTNILIDYLRGIPQAWAEMKRYQRRAVSLITWMEIMAGARDEDAAATREFLFGFICLPISMEVAERAATIRRSRRMKLPDAMILATAEIGGHILVTRNTRDFLADDPGIRVPYQI